MDKTARKVYKFLLHRKGHGFNFLRPEEFPVPEKDFLDACAYLVKKEYARYYPSDEKPSAVVLTHEGVHKREIDIENAVKLFFTHYLPGVFTGIVLSFIAPYLIALLQVLIKLLPS